MTHAIRLALALSLLVTTSPAALAQTLYKSVTADGRIVYSHHPPSDGKVLKTITPDRAASTALPVSAMEQLRKLRALRPTAAAPSTGVVLFSASWCGYCARADLPDFFGPLISGKMALQPKGRADEKEPFY